jgi:hypothetical protein
LREIYKLQNFDVKRKPSLHEAALR